MTSFFAADVHTKVDISKTIGDKLKKVFSKNNISTATDSNNELESSDGVGDKNVVFCCFSPFGTGIAVLLSKEEINDLLTFNSHQPRCPPPLGR